MKNRVLLLLAIIMFVPFLCYGYQTTVLNDGMLSDLFFGTISGCRDAIDCLESRDNRCLDLLVKDKDITLVNGRIPCKNLKPVMEYRGHTLIEFNFQSGPGISVYAPAEAFE